VKQVAILCRDTVNGAKLWLAGPGYRLYAAAGLWLAVAQQLLPSASKQLACMAAQPYGWPQLQLANGQWQWRQLAAVLQLPANTTGVAFSEALCAAVWLQ